jgi:hypothetical protein
VAGTLSADEEMVGGAVPVGMAIAGPVQEGKTRRKRNKMNTTSNSSKAQAGTNYKDPRRSPRRFRLVAAVVSDRRAPAVGTPNPRGRPPTITGVPLVTEPRRVPADSTGAHLGIATNYVVTWRRTRTVGTTTHQQLHAEQRDLSVGVTPLARAPTAPLNRRSTPRFCKV